MKLPYIISIFILLCSCSGNKQPINYVNPFIGTGAHGHTYPGATSPFGAVQLSPDTRTENWDACSGYHYSDSAIIGFSHTHLSGTGCVDFGDILVRPTISNNFNYKPTPFLHTKEQATPGYYSTLLPQEKVKVELTATTHCGIHRYNFDNNIGKLIFDLQFSLGADKVYNSYIKLTSATTIEGMRVTGGWADNQYIYFAAELSSPIDKFNIILNNQVLNNTTSAEGTDIKAVLLFNNIKNKPITLKVGLSIVSIEDAKQNLYKEAINKNFDTIKQENTATWNKYLSKIIVKSKDKNILTNFYTALYHTMVVPNQISDVNGLYRSANNQITKVKNGRKEYSTLSVWDIYRTWAPLMTIIDTTLVNDVVNSMLNFYDLAGQLPIWPLASKETSTMIGYHSVSIIADAYMKGIRNYDAKKALNAMVESSLKNKKGASLYHKLGYIPCNVKGESVSCTLEYSYDDWCIAQMANAMQDSIIAQKYYNKALNYINVFDPNTLFFRGRRIDGNFESGFNPLKVSRNLTEANYWQYRFAATHDINGMVQLFGGKQPFISALDSLFSLNSNLLEGDLQDITGLIGQYAHGNEPGHHIPYIYNYLAEAYKTQEWVRTILTEMYSTKADGLCGNEDCGQMSAWYVCSALGLYQLCPASNQYLLTSPLFDESTISLANGKTLVIKASNPLKNKYIQAVRLNNKEINRSYITYDEIMGGGVLEFILSNKPNYNWANTTMPYSYTSSQKVSTPYINTDVYLFEKPLNIKLANRTKGAIIRYTLDGEEPNETSLIYTQPIYIDKTTTIKAKAYCKNMEPSQTFTITAQKALAFPAIKVAKAQNGVKTQYFEGNFNCINDLNHTTPKAVYIGNNINIAQAPQEDHFGFIFSGYIYAPVTGKYVFETKSDDGSVLYIDNKEIVNNDGSHAMVPATGAVVLQQGYHKYSLYYFEDYEGQGLNLSWKLPLSNNFMPIESKFLFY